MRGYTDAAIPLRQTNTQPRFTTRKAKLRLNNKTKTAMCANRNPMRHPTQKNVQKQNQFMTQCNQLLQHFKCIVHATTKPQLGFMHFYIHHPISLENVPEDEVWKVSHTKAKPTIVKTSMYLWTSSTRNQNSNKR